MEVAQISHFMYEKTGSVTCPRFHTALPSACAPKRTSSVLESSGAEATVFVVFFFFLISLRI